MVAADLFAAIAIDFDSQDVADGDGTVLDLARVDVEVAVWGLAVVDADRRCSVAHVAGITDLTTASSVERCFGEHDLDFVAL